MPDIPRFSATHLPCPKGRGRTHHLIPTMGTLVCTYCALTERQIRDRAPMLHQPRRCYCPACKQERVYNCRTCHLPFTMHLIEKK